MQLHLTKEDLQSISSLYETFGNCAMVVNDIISLNKELRAWNNSHKGGAFPLNTVIMLSEQTGLGQDSAKRILWMFCREWEIQFRTKVDERLAIGCSRDLEVYMDGLDLISGGNEAWSWTTGRYH